MRSVILSQSYMIRLKSFNNRKSKRVLNLL